jgi:hypothetical protein
VLRALTNISAHAILLALCRILANDSLARKGYQRLYELVEPSNPDAAANIEKVLGEETIWSEPIQSIVRFFISDKQDCLTARHKHASISADAPPDLPFGLDEPVHWDFLQVYRLSRS